MHQPHRLSVLSLVLAALAACGGSPGSAPAAEPLDLTTEDGRWRVTTSLAYDALYYLDVLTGSAVTLADPALAAERARALARMDEAERAALEQVSVLRGWTGENVAAPLTLMLDEPLPADLAGLAALFADGPGCLARAEAVNRALTGAGLDPAQQAAAGQACAGAAGVAAFMQRDGWEGRWRSEVVPVLDARIAELAAGLGAAPLDVLALENAYAGKAYPPGALVVYVQRYASGHGSSLGDRGFITSTDASQGPAATLSMALHELAHDPFPHDDRFAALAAAYAADPFFAAGVSPEYPSAALWFSEELTDALEVYLDFAARDGAADPAPYLAELKARANRLAPVLFDLARRQDPCGRGEPWAAFVLRMVDEGRLTPGRLGEAYAAL